MAPGLSHEPRILPIPMLRHRQRSGPLRSSAVIKGSRSNLLIPVLMPPPPAAAVVGSGGGSSIHPLLRRQRQSLAPGRLMPHQRQQQHITNSTAALSLSSSAEGPTGEEERILLRLLDVDELNAGAMCREGMVMN